MAKRTFRKKFRKRRMSRRRRTTRRKGTLPKYDGMVRVKIEVSKEMIVPAASANIVEFNVTWGNQIAAPGTQNSIVIRDSPEWLRYQALYNYFRVQGVSMKYIPYGFQQGPAAVTSQELLVGSSVEGEALTQNTVKLAVDFHVQRASSNYHKYVGVAKSRMRNSGGGIAGIAGSSSWLRNGVTDAYS